MLPSYFFDIKNDSNYFKRQYPETSDCILIDQHIGSITKDIADISARQASKKKEGKTFTQQLQGDAIRTAAKKNLRTLLLEKENKSDILNCRNKIELQRQEESVATFDQYASKADVSVLNSSTKRQIFYAIAGSAVILTTVFLLTRKK